MNLEIYLLNFEKLNLGEGIYYIKGIISNLDQ